MNPPWIPDPHSTLHFWDPGILSQITLSAFAGLRGHFTWSVLPRAVSEAEAEAG